MTSMPTMIPVESSHLAAIGYYPADGVLYVDFLGGARYAYDGVPPGVHDAIMKALSKGCFLNAEVKGVYPCRKLNHAPHDGECDASCYGYFDN